MGGYLIIEGKRDYGSRTNASYLAEIVAIVVEFCSDVRIGEQAHSTPEMTTPELPFYANPVPG